MEQTPQKRECLETIEDPTLGEVLKSDILIFAETCYIRLFRIPLYCALFVIALMLFVRLFRVVQALFA